MPPFPIEDGSVSGRLLDESGKFNLNNLTNGEGIVNEDAKSWFERLLVRVGLPAELSQAVIDWQDPNDEPTGPMGQKVVIMKVWIQVTWLRILNSTVLKS